MHLNKLQTSIERLTDDGLKDVGLFDDGLSFIQLIVKKSFVNKSIIFFILFFPFVAHVQSSIKRQKLIGGSGTENFNAIKSTSDGGFLVCGSTDSYVGDGDIDDPEYRKQNRQTLNVDCLIMKLNPDFSIQWERLFGGFKSDAALAVSETPDGGCIAVGNLYATDGSNNRGCFNSDKCKDGWAVKLRKDGTTEWQTFLGGSGDDYFDGVQITNDGGYVLVGYTNSNDGDLSLTNYHDTPNNLAFGDAWLVKLDNTGKMTQQKSVGGNTKDLYTDIEKIPDGGFIISGFTNSMNGDLTGTKFNFSREAWLTKLDSNLNTVWQRTVSLPDNIDSRAYSVTVTKNGEYLIGGTYATGYSGDNGLIMDYYLAKFSRGGDLMWQKKYGGSGDDFARSIIEANDGTILVSGYSASNDGDVTNGHGSKDFWILRCTASGNKIEQLSLGGSDSDIGYASTTDKNGRCYFSGFSKSTDRDIKVTNHGDFDGWIFELNLSNNIDTSQFVPPTDTIRTTDVTGKSSDIQMGIAATPANFKKYSTETIRLISKNIGNTAFTDVNVLFQFPDNTVTGGTAITSTGDWKEYCNNGTHCYTWTIKSLALNTIATADIPIFILNEDSAFSVTTILLSSLPPDSNDKNNTASLILNKFVEIQLELKNSGNSNNSFNSNQIYPNPTTGNISVEFFSEQNSAINFIFYNALGNIVLQETRRIEIGTNNLIFNCDNLPQGIYFISEQNEKNNFTHLRFMKN